MSPVKKSPRAPVSALARGAQLAARREHTRAELARKLRMKGHAPEEIGGALETLGKKKFIDDNRAARALIDERIRAGRGPKKIQVDLQKRGIPPATARALLAELDPPDQERARAAELAQKMLARPGAHPQKVAGFLARRGFTAGAVASALAGCVWAEGAEADDGTECDDDE